MERWSGGANKRTPGLRVQERKAGPGICTEAGEKGELLWGRSTPIKGKRTPCTSYFWHQPQPTRDILHLLMSFFCTLSGSYMDFVAVV